MINYYLAFDLETTGLNPDYHEIAQIGIILLTSDLEEVSSGEIRLMPEHWDRAEKKALEVNKINPKTWKSTYPSNKIALEKIISSIYRHIEPGQKIGLLGHNIIGFDIPFLKKIMNQHDIEWIFGHHHIDTMVWASFWARVSNTKLHAYSLSQMTAALGVKLTNAHDAVADVKATVELARAMITSIQFMVKHGQKGIV